MDHPTFPKINTTLRLETGGVAEWVATEKIHGAQLVVAATREGVQIGKRKAWLNDADAFFGWQLIAQRLREAAISIAASLKAAQVVIYGELCGGKYPHPDVEPVPGLSAVQTGIWYAPDLHYVVFDIRVYLDDAAAASEFLGWDELCAACDGAGLPTAPLLGRGKRSDLQRLQVRFPSKLPKRLGLPAIAGNTAEGFVLKPAARIAAASRPVVKHKIPEFNDARFDESTAFDPNAPLSLEELQRLCVSLVNDSRVASARSKVGTARNAILEEVILDVLVDLECVFPRRMSTLTADESQRIQADLAKLAEDVVPHAVE